MPRFSRERSLPIFSRGEQPAAPESIAPAAPAGRAGVDGLLHQNDRLGHRLGDYSLRRPDRSSTGPGSQRAAAIQPMVAIDDQTLFYHADSLGFVDEPKMKAGAKLAQWVTTIEDMTGLTSQKIVNPSDFIGLLKATAWSDTVQKAIEQKLMNNNKVFKYSSYFFKNEQTFIEKLPSESSFLVTRPGDLLDTDPLVSDTYVPKLACVLQALINAGVTLPDFSKESGADDFEKFHNYTRKQVNKDYDLDQVVYKIYRGLDLTLAVNQPAEWKNLRLQAGTYIFTMKGHNFMVQVEKSGDTNDKHKPVDLPQKIVTTYRPNELILYVWKV